MNLIDYMGANTDGQFLERLQQEVQAWERDGTITPEQGRAILSRYPADSSVGAVRRRHSLVVGISVLGAVLVGLGIISFFAANWDDISRSVRLGMLIAGVILSYGAGFLLWQRLGYTALGLALVLLGCIIFGAGVHLIGQIYNVPVDHPNLTAFWFLGVAPLAYATRSRPIMALAVALFLVAVAFRIAHWDRFAGEIQTVGYFALYLGLGLAIYAVGRAKQQLPGWEQMGSVFRAIGVVVALGALYLMTFFELHEESREVVGPGYRYWVLAYAASAVAVASLAWTVWRTPIASQGVASGIRRAGGGRIAPRRVPPRGQRSLSGGGGIRHRLQRPPGSLRPGHDGLGVPAGERGPDKPVHGADRPVLDFQVLRILDSTA